MRERWEEATPEERALMRRTYQERLRGPDPRLLEPRHGRGPRDRGEYGAPPAPGYGNGYGMGYEQRRFDSREPDVDAMRGRVPRGGHGSGGHERRDGGRR